MEQSQDIKKVQLFLALRGICNFEENGIDGLMNEETSLAISTYLSRNHPNFAGSPSGNGAVQTILFDIYPLLNSSPEGNTKELALAKNMALHMQNLYTTASVIYGSLSTNHSAFNPTKVLTNNISNIQTYLNEIITPKKSK